MTMTMDQSKLTAIARSQVYQFLAQSFSFPDEPTWATIKSQKVGVQTEMAIANLSLEVGEVDALWECVKKAFHRFRDRGELESEYFELFEVTRKKAPCPLYESFYRNEDRVQTMADLVRFYNFFGLSLGSSAKEMPDHMKVELEFLHYLTFLEAQSRDDEDSMASLLRAQRDFHERHLQIWTPQLWEKIESQESEYFSALAGLTHAFLTIDRDYLLRRNEV